jgi:hypothetical protein
MAPEIVAFGQKLRDNISGLVHIAVAAVTFGENQPYHWALLLIGYLAYIQKQEYGKSIYIL